MSVRNYAVEVEGWGHRSTLFVTAASPAKARYLAWLEVSEPTEVSFAEFLRRWVRSVRLAHHHRATRYTYAAERYGAAVTAGQRVRLKRGQGEGVAAEPPGSNPRHHHIFVCRDGGPPEPYHPSDVEAA